MLIGIIVAACGIGIGSFWNRKTKRNPSVFNNDVRYSSIGFLTEGK